MYEYITMDVFFIYRFPNIIDLTKMTTASNDQKNSAIFAEDVYLKPFR